MPHEFWREVVDRVAAEAPDTLLLAEAFWLLEGYFVRTPGHAPRLQQRLHAHAARRAQRRVPGADQGNARAFDPEVLKRFVNFLNNPDERTAVDQFGDDDRYFGAATLMATLPGLPMFGHGQIEGYAEKYGMEFRRARWHEEPKGWLIERHEREIFRCCIAGGSSPRRTTSDSTTSRRPTGWPRMSSRFSNRDGDDRALVLVHSRYAEAEGSLRMSAPSLTARQRAVASSNGSRWPTPWACRVTMPPGPSSATSSLVREGLRGCAGLHHDGFAVSLRAYERRVCSTGGSSSTATAPSASSRPASAGMGAVPSVDEAVDGICAEWRAAREPGPSPDASIQTRHP